MWQLDMLLLMNIVCLQALLLILGLMRRLIEVGLHVRILLLDIIGVLIRMMRHWILTMLWCRSQKGLGMEITLPPPGILWLLLLVPTRVMNWDLLFVGLWVRDFSIMLRLVLLQIRVKVTSNHLRILITMMTTDIFLVEIELK